MKIKKHPSIRSNSIKKQHTLMINFTNMKVTLGLDSLAVIRELLNKKLERLSFALFDTLKMSDSLRVLRTL